MNRIVLLGGLLVGLLLLVAGACFIWRQLQREARLAARLKSIRYSAAGTVPTEETAGGVTGLVTGLGSAVARSGLLSRKTLAGLERSLNSTGLRGPSALGLFLGAKILLLLILPLVTLTAVPYLHVSPMTRNGTVVGAALVGLLGPDWWIGRRYKRYLAGLTVGLPDAMDLMVICAEAGLSFEPAIQRVAREIRAAHPVVSDEFNQTASELRVASDSKEALTKMGTRTGLDGLKRMASVLVQTMRYGTPLSDALRVLSAEMRHEMLLQYETRAARLPVLLTIPMILFILPCIFLIVGGPAAVQALKTYHH